MTLRIRQVALVAADLDPVVRQLCELLGVEVCFRDPAVGHFGLHNALMVLGDTFLEVVSPQREGTTAGRLLARRGGDGGYMVLLQTDSLAADRARFQRLGVRTVWEVEREDIAAVHLHPKDVGAAIVSFDQPREPAQWPWGGPSWRQHARTRRVVDIVGVELQSEDPQALAARWAQVLDVPSRPLGDGSYGIALGAEAAPGHSQLRFVRAMDTDMDTGTDGRGAGMSAVVIRRAPGTTVNDATLCGTRFIFV